MHKPKKRSATKDIYAALREMIVSLEISPGSRITETLLADYFEVSRTPVREALQRLDNEGLLKVRPKLGYFVRSIDLVQISQYYDVRVALENMVLAQIDAQDGGGLLRKLANEWNPDATSFGVNITSDLKFKEEQFHLDLAAISKNDVLRDYIADLNEKIRVVRLLGWPDEQSVIDTYTEHFRICTHLINEDVKAAQAEMTKHIRHSQECASQVTLQQIFKGHNQTPFE